MDNSVMVCNLNADYNDFENNIPEEVTQFLKKMLSKWNIVPGDKVVIKPNFVKESHLQRLDEWDYIITHGSVIKFVLAYVLKALDDKGEVYIVDAPQTDSDWNKIIRNVGLDRIVAEVQKTTKVPIRYYDLREERWYFKNGITVRRKKLSGDPKGYVSVDLGENSAFTDKKNKDYYGADYDTSETKKYHNEKQNIYVISRTILDCDVFINIPKLKTHKLGGITACLKNLVGTCVVKNSIPHHTIGSPENGGDKFPKATAKNQAESKLKSIALKLLRSKNPVINYPFIAIKCVAGIFLGKANSKTIRNGSWHGNDTIWRATLDLNRILLYADKNGTMRHTVQRKYYTLIDGILAGEGDGPMEADPKASGILISGSNPVYVDTVAATLMGFDYKKIPTISKAYEIAKYPLAGYGAGSVTLESNNDSWQKKISEFHYQDTLKFKPHFGWIGNIELK